MFQFSKEFIEQLLQGIFTGKFTPTHLPAQLYFAIADYLKKGIYEGYGIDFNSLIHKLATGDGGKFVQSDLALLTELRTNTYLFSAAKAYQQVREMNSFLTTDDGKIRPFKEFQEKAQQTYDLYNKTWLRTEYDTAIGQAQAARMWNEIQEQADILPILQYSAIIDKGTSDICRPLNGITAPVNDPIWKRIAPLNHFNCRCVLIQLDEGKLTSDKKKKAAVDKVLDKMDPMFKMNPGESGYVFSPKHPYFDIAPKDKDLAKKNFNLPIPKRDRNE
jgi:SPP1 gp7 family putative phage head morphogenesis protein